MTVADEIFNYVLRIAHYTLLLGDDSMLEDRKVELTALRDKLNEMGNSL